MNVIQRLLVITPGDLGADPRARRAAAVARRHGFEVTSLVIALNDQAGPTSTVPGIQTFQASGDRLTSALRRIGLGGGTMNDRPFIRELRGLYRLLRLATQTAQLLRAGRSVKHADVVHAHDLDTLPAASLHARRLDARLVYDAHEIYASQEPNPPRIYRRVTTWLEGRLARNAEVVTVNDLIAVELERILRLPTRPRVVLSCPERLEHLPPRPERHEHRLKAIYQGAMGPGRSVADLFDAAAALGDDVLLSARIAGIDIEGLRKECAGRRLAGRFLVLDPVAPGRLVEALLEFDIGLIINRPVTRNDELVLPNKLFEYMMAGLAIVAPRLPALTQVVDEEGVGITFTPSDPSSLAHVLDQLAADRPRVEAMKIRARQLALTRYNAEAQEPPLLAAWGL